MAGWFTVPPGDAAGPYLGRVQRGDLGGVETAPWRAGPKVAERLPGPLRWAVARAVGRRLRLPVTVVHHAAVLGATGTGKSESIYGCAEWALRHGWRVIYASAKEPAPADSVAPRLASVAAAWGLTTHTLSPDDPPDLLRGTPREVVDRLIAAENWGDPYWANVAAEAVAVALAARDRLGLPLRDLGDLADTLARLKDHAKRDPDLGARAAAIPDEALRGAATRYRTLAEHLNGWTRSDGWDFGSADLIVAELPTARRPEAAGAILRMIMKSLVAWLRDPTRRTDTRPVLVVEEVGGWAADPNVARDLRELVERARSASAFCVLSAQDPGGFGDPAIASTILTNAAVITFRQGPAAEVLAGLAGTRSAELGSIGYGPAGIGNGGFTQRQRIGKVDPQLVRSLGRGELLVTYGGRFALVAAGLAASAYRQPTEASPAVWVPAEALGELFPEPRGPEFHGWPAPVVYGPVIGPEAAVQHPDNNGVLRPYREEPAPPGAPTFVPGER